jgi:hypothetical protein
MLSRQMCPAVVLPGLYFWRACLLKQPCIVVFAFKIAVMVFLSVFVAFAAATAR